ncbi:angiopoietin-related protein 7-like isoform X2 [Drosophila innubila]|uniref:angiopoietin-related protein 7-like isoform X2 n=1 Tax=Drosophila innubila TaxID=198719 RepID=UPI00148D24F5|nr:angiopoietin-related protein 7-like isoform X2 [Drosophila innubila]
MLLKSVWNLFLFILLLLVSWNSSSGYSIPDIEDIETNDLIVDTKDAPHYLIAYNTVKPLLSKLKEKVRELYQIIEPNDSEMNYVQELKSHNSELQNTNEFLKKTVQQLTNNMELTVKDVIDQLKALKTEKLQKELAKKATCIEELDIQIDELKPERDSDVLNAFELAEKDEEIDGLKSQVKNIYEMETQIKEFKNELKLIELTASCIPFGEDPGLHEIKLPGIDSFEVLCDSETVGPGWTVIQQRIINSEGDFDRDWDTYRAGFGSFDGQFFLGLEKIHQLTSSQRYELYIHMVSFGGVIFYARYDDFKVGGEEEDYELSSLGEFSGSEGIVDTKMLRLHENQKFTTFDRDNDNDDWAVGKCPLDQPLGGWWLHACAKSNLNGNHWFVEIEEEESDYFTSNMALKKIKMLIRPKSY